MIKFSRRVLTAVLTLTLVCGVMGYSYPIVAAQAVDNSIIRIHVVAHDDTPEEQSAKLSVRDRVLELVGALVEQAVDSKEAQRIIESHLPELKQVAEEELSSLGSDHKVAMQWGKFVFPTRVYGSTSLPAGSYQALNVIIGSGKGKNWWCIMYPPLCYVEGVIHKSHEVNYQFALLNLFRSIWRKIKS